MDTITLIYNIISSKVSLEILLCILIAFNYLIQKNNIERIEYKLQNNQDITTDRLNNIDNRYKIIEENVKNLHTEVIKISNNMDKYAIINHFVIDNDISEIDAVIYMSATSVSNIIKEFILKSREENKEIVDDVIINEICNDVENDRRKYHSELVTKGISTRTIEIWEETEKEAFESFMFRLLQTYKKLIGIKGNGTVKDLIDRECIILRDYIYNDFMKRLKRRLAIKDD